MPFMASLLWRGAGTCRVRRCLFIIGLFLRFGGEGYRRDDRQLLSTLVLIAVAAVLAPILSELTGRLGISPRSSSRSVSASCSVPYVFNLAHVDSVVTGLSDLGLTYLVFLLAGYVELDLERIKGNYT